VQPFSSTDLADQLAPLSNHANVYGPCSPRQWEGAHVYATGGENIEGEDDGQRRRPTLCRSLHQGVLQTQVHQAGEISVPLLRDATTGQL